MEINVLEDLKKIDVPNFLLILVTNSSSSSDRLASQRHPDAELREMNKPPQPITGPTSVPLPSPSPGLTQVRANDKTQLALTDQSSVH